MGRTVWFVCVHEMLLSAAASNQFYSCSSREKKRRYALQLVCFVLLELREGVMRMEQSLVSSSICWGIRIYLLGVYNCCTPALVLCL